MPRAEHHYSQRTGWLRAAVLGANDGIISTASLLMGVSTASGGDSRNMLIAGTAAWVAGAISMAAGEYVSVSSQADSEKEDLKREEQSLMTNASIEKAELSAIYTERGVDAELAQQVAEQLMAHDALDAHARDELGLNKLHTTRPVQAALTSGASFTVGAMLPLTLAVALPNPEAVLITVGTGSLICLAVLGGLAAYGGGSSILKGALRVTLWGAAAMAITAIIGAEIHRVIGQ